MKKNNSLTFLEKGIDFKLIPSRSCNSMVLIIENNSTAVTITRLQMLSFLKLLALKKIKLEKGE